jgi:hypothetical protein
VLDHDAATHGVAAEDGALDPSGLEESGEIVGELGELVRIAPTAGPTVAAELVGQGTVRPGEKRQLLVPAADVTAPSMHEDERLALARFPEMHLVAMNLDEVIDDRAHDPSSDVSSAIGHGRPLYGRVNSSFLRTRSASVSDSACWPG